MRARFLQDCKSAQICQVGYVPTLENAADMLTKPLDRSKFNKHRMYLMGMADGISDMGSTLMDQMGIAMDPYVRVHFGASGHVTQLARKL